MSCAIAVNYFTALIFCLCISCYCYLHVFPGRFDEICCYSYAGYSLLQYIVCEIVNYRVSVNAKPLSAIRVCKVPVNRCLYSIVGLTWSLAVGMFATMGMLCSDHQTKKFSNI